MWVVFKLVITVHDAPNLCVHVKNLLNALLFLFLCERCATVVTKNDIHACEMSSYSVIIESLIRVSNQPSHLNRQNCMLKAECQTTQKTELLLTFQSMDLCIKRWSA